MGYIPYGLYVVERNLFIDALLKVEKFDSRVALKVPLYPTSSTKEKSATTLKGNKTQPPLYQNAHNYPSIRTAGNVERSRRPRGNDREIRAKSGNPRVLAGNNRAPTPAPSVAHSGTRFQENCAPRGA